MLTMLKDGGVCSPKGFTACGWTAGIKASGNPDMALLKSEKAARCFAVFTTNKVKAAPVLYDKSVLEHAHFASAVIVNSGNANACTGPKGLEDSARTAALVEDLLGLAPKSVLVCSTGVIGHLMPMDKVEAAIPHLVEGLHADASKDFASAILTTDKVLKSLAIEIETAKGKVTVGGCCKGSGMIHPNMGTMLCFLTTDCAISPEMIRTALLETVNVSFNRISVDGDTSTNDSCIVLANGLAGNETITAKGPDYDAFLEALQALCMELAKKMASDGEGAKHLITWNVEGGKDEAQAETVSKSVISSTLTKAAIFGADANWGRVLCAMGYSGVEFDPDKVDVHFASAAGDIAVCEKGRGLDFDEELAKKILTEHDVEINITMGEGEATCTCWGCDITYDYIKINGDYRT